MPSSSTKSARLSPSSPAAIQAIDDLLASVGLEHGRRKLGRDGIVRQAKYAPARELHADELRQPQRPVRPRQIEVVQAPGWAQHPWLVHGFSTRTGGASTVYRAAREGQTASEYRGPGELNLGFTQTDERALVEKNRRRFVQAVTGAKASQPGWPLVTLRQIHSQITYKIGRHDELAPNEPIRPRRGDGLMTRRPGILLGIQTADCIPVMVADTRRQAVAIFHAGWRGTLKRIVEGGVGRMRMEFGSKPKDLIAAIGPGIGQCCYAVGEEVRTGFRSQFAYADELFCEVYDSDPVREKYPLLFLTARAPGHSPIGPSLHLDLFEANRRQLLDAGLGEESIAVLGDCTSCQTNRYFSHRAERGFTGRMMAVIGIRE
jgi:YfiH family protein